MSTQSVSEKLKARSIRNPETGCLEWQGARWNNGYGVIRFNGRNEGAHRVAFKLWVGEIPQGHEICHRCDNPPCIEPSHLFSGTRLENEHDKIAKGRRTIYQLDKTHCPQGHEYSVENTYVYPTTSGGATRKCKTCINEKALRRYHEGKLANPS